METVIYLNNRGIYSQVINTKEFMYFNWNGFKTGDPVYVDNFSAKFESYEKCKDIEVIKLNID